MPTEFNSRITQVVGEVASGHQGAAERLFVLLYDVFHDMAQRYLRVENVGHTLSPTALVHEAYLKLVDQNQVDWQGKTHFLAIGAQAMRRILVDYARQKKRIKRGGRLQRIILDEQVALSPQRDEDLLALDEALGKLAQVDPRQAAIVELRFFGGLNVAEVAAVLGVSKRTIESEWTAVRAWLRRELQEKTSS
ncbi:MAG: sigma-70 family RNA polymerase sigma factor [Phycisphaerales bacterium]|nr:sigma-70 family RNA polymerase sigma factor [Phycisphaerales bacterium]